MEHKTTCAAFELTRHDHHRCIADALRAADEICEGRGVRLTPLRRAGAGTGVGWARAGARV